MIDFREVRPGVHLVTLDVENTNVVLLADERGAMLVDTGSSKEAGAEIRTQVSATIDVPLTHVVLTHGHWDHSFGLSAFDDLTILAQENTAMDLSCAENSHRAAQDGFDLSGIPEPTTTIANIGFVDLGDFPVELAHFGQAHSRSDLIVGLPGRDILIVGDLVDSAPPQFDETSSLKGWVTALDSLYSLLKPDTVVIPGHGDLLGPPEVAHFRSGLAAIWDQSEWAYNQGIPLEKVYDHDNLQWPWDRPTAENAIRVGYRDLS